MSRYFTEEHEWVEVEGKIATVGITEYAQQQLGDVVFVDVPAEGKQFDKGDEAAVVESVKAASDIVAPMDGEIVEVNEALADNPGLVNEQAMGDAWFFKMRPADIGQMDEYMDEAEYKQMIG